LNITGLEVALLLNFREDKLDQHESGKISVKSVKSVVEILWMVLIRCWMLDVGCFSWALSRPLVLALK
jgi:hypothetical protein